MTPSQAVLLVGLTTCLVSEGLGLTLPGILSSFTTSRKSDEAEGEKDQELKEQQEKYPTTHRPTRPPLIPAVPHPADTPLNPLTNPNHPLHPDNLPSLHLPSFPHFDRETIHATKTVFVELTDRLTIHPVCMTAYKVKPPCLPFDPHHHQQIHHHPKDQQDRYEDNKLQEASVIKPTAVIELEPTRIIGGETFSEASSLAAAAEDNVQPAEIPVVEPPSEEGRSARYMEITPSITSPEKVEIKDAPAEHHQGSGGGGSHGTSPLNVVQSLFHHPVTHYKTKTLLVTKVEKILDTRVTATLLAENCIPTNSHIPLCAPHGGLVGPGFHGYHNNDIYTETFGGHIVSGLYTEKRPGYSPDGDVHEQVHPDKEADHQAKEGEQDEIDAENNEDEE